MTHLYPPKSNSWLRLWSSCRRQTSWYCFNPQSGKSCTDIKNRSGPRTDPCGTPLITSIQFEQLPWHLQLFQSVWRCSSRTSLWFVSDYSLTFRSERLLGHRPVPFDWWVQITPRRERAPFYSKLECVNNSAQVRNAAGSAGGRVVCTGERGTLPGSICQVAAAVVVLEWAASIVWAGGRNAYLRAELLHPTTAQQTHRSHSRLPFTAPVLAIQRVSQTRNLSKCSRDAVPPPRKSVYNVQL